jgi:hypothetical protein
MTDIEHAAQMHYGWDDWNDPFWRALVEAQAAFILATLPPNALLWPFATVMRSRYSSGIGRGEHLT